jgi:hypothetical protein
VSAPEAAGVASPAAPLPEIAPVPPRARSLWTPLLLCSVVLALFFAPAFHPDAQFLHRDTGRMHHPMKRWVASELAAGRLPQWNPYAGLGTPVVSGAIDAVFHPFTLLLVALPFEAAFKAWVLLSYLLAALGGWLWARGLGAGETGAAVAGLGFALSGYLVSSSDNLTYLTSMAAIPLVLAAAHAYLHGGGPRRLALLALAAGLCAAGGDPQTWCFLAAGLPVYALVLGPRDTGRAVLARRAGIALVAAIAGAAPVLAPVAAWVPHSPRAEDFDWIEYVRYNLPPIRLAELVVPNLLRPPAIEPESAFYRAVAGSPWTPLPWVVSEYVGAAAAALAAYGAVRRREGRALLLVAAVFAWMAMGHHAGFGQLARHLPLLSGFRYWEKAAVWIPVLVAATAALGIQALADLPERGGRFAAVAAAAGVAGLAAGAAGALAPAALARALAPAAGQDLAAAGILAGNLAGGLLHAGAALLLLSLAVRASASVRLAVLGPALVAAVAIGDVATATVRAYVLSPAAVAVPASPFAEFLRARPSLSRVVTPFEPGRVAVAGLSGSERMAVYGVRGLYSGWNMPQGVANFESYSALWPVRTARYRRRAGLVKQLPGVGLWGVSHAVVPDRPERAAEMNLPPPYTVAAVDSATRAVLLEIPHRPRAYLARTLETVDRRAAMEFALDGRSVMTDRTVVEGPLPPGYAPPEGDAQLAVAAPDRVTVRSRATGTALLVLNDVHAAGWDADVDGRPAEILPTNYLARGVWVPPGEHLVTFRYRAPHLLTGWALLAAFAAALATWAAVERRRAPTSAAGRA